MENLRSSIIETHYPPLRRKNKSIMDSFLKQIGSSFLTFIEQTPHDIQNRPSLKESQEMIEQHYCKIHEIINSIDQHLTRRLEHHETQVLAIVKGEIESMRAETKILAQTLNQAIKQKNTEDEIWQLSNELDYFKHQTYKLFQQNKQVREEMTALRQQIKQYQIECEINDKLMQKLKRSHMKAKIIKAKAAQLLGHTQPDKMNDQHSFKIKPQRKTTKTQNSEEKDPFPPFKVDLPLQSIVQIKMEKDSQLQRHLLTDIDEIHPFNQIQIDNTSSYILEQQNKFGIADLPPVNFIKVNSQFDDEALPIASRGPKMDKFSQTDLVFFEQPAKQCQQQINSFSKTSCIQYPQNSQLKKTHQINLYKNGFYVRSYNQRSTTLNTPSPSPAPNSKREIRHTRYMTTAFNNNKIHQDLLGVRHASKKEIRK